MMEYDTQKAARVWQRVQEGKQPSPRQGEPLAALILEHMQLSSLYMQMSRQRSGQESTVLMGLARQARMQAACLRGIAVLTGGSNPAFSPTPMSNTASDALLRRCYGQELRLLREYENRREDPEYGPVFERMARREQEHCCTLLELIGSMKPAGN